MCWKMKRKKNNDGISLIEVIVSMLILAIIAFPFLNSMAISAKANKNARIRQYANALGQNVMESLKCYDLSEVALRFNDVINTTTDAFNIVPIDTIENPVYALGFYEGKPNVNNGFDILNKINCNDLGVDMSITQEGGTYKFNPTTSKLYDYVIRGAKEGTQIFDVVIQYDGTKYQGDSSVEQNNYLLPEISSLDFEKTAFINPDTYNIIFTLDPTTGEPMTDTSGNYMYSDNNTYDKQALDRFYDMSFNYYSYLGVTPPAISVKDDFKRKITRKAIITIENNPFTGDDQKPYIVSMKYEFIYTQSAGDSYKLQDVDEDIVLEYPTAYSNVQFSNLNNIYLFQEPLDTSMYQRSQADVVHIQNKSNLTNTINVYIADQLRSTISSKHTYVVATKVDSLGVTTLDQTGVVFYYKDPNNSVEIGAYTNDNFGAIGAFVLDGTNYKQELVVNKYEKLRIYDVSVRIYEHNSTKELLELNSTITR